MQSILPVALVLSLLTGCATLGTDTDDQLTLEDAKGEIINDVDYLQKSGLTKYSFAKKQHNVQWATCTVISDTKPERSILLMHDESEAFDPSTLCKSWLGQAFLSEDTAIIAINRPGFGTSTGTRDMGGEQSIAAIKAAATEAAKSSDIVPPTGIWGYGLGAMVAGLAARDVPNLTFMILGGGIYDFEETLRLTKSKALKDKIVALQKKEGELAVEDRSISYDVEGFPKTIALYHGKKDTTAPLRQATVFRDTLVSNEYKATLQAIEGLGHNIPPAAHQKILKVLVRSHP